MSKMSLLIEIKYIKVFSFSAISKYELLQTMKKFNILIYSFLQKKIVYSQRHGGLQPILNEVLDNL